MIEYPKFAYIFPPRAENAVPTTELDVYDNGYYLAQPKLNGDCVEIYTNGIEVIVMDRHKKQFNKCNDTLLEKYKHLHRGTKGNWMILVGEFMIKSKRDRFDKIWNEKFVIFDIIAYDGMQLIGKTFKQRVELLDELYGLNEGFNQSDDKFLLKTDIEDIYRVKSFFENFKALYEELIQIDMYEGFVFKRCSAPLENGQKVNNNALSQFKVRKQTKNYLY